MRQFSYFYTVLLFCQMFVGSCGVMTSITKHQYTLLNDCHNKENEAVNGRQNDPIQKKSTNTLESGFDWTRKEAISEQRKLRLAQVKYQKFIDTTFF